MAAYAELQVTTNFSFLRGGSHAEELVAQAKHLDLPLSSVREDNFVFRPRSLEQWRAMFGG
jgi:error-prone DNA polymerase